MASRRTPVNVGQSLAKCPTLEPILLISKRHKTEAYWKKKDSPTATVAVTGGKTFLSHPRHNAFVLEPEFMFNRIMITLEDWCHLHPPGMLTNLHSLPSRQGMVGTEPPATLAEAPSWRYLKQSYWLIAFNEKPLILHYDYLIGWFTAFTPAATG